MPTYAIIKTGGKQYRVAPGDVLDVERFTEHEPGDTIDIDEVLLVNQDGDVTIGAPYIEGARVIVKIEHEGKAKKIIVFKYKPKVRYRRKQGHRQRFARIIIEGIELGATPKAEATKEA